MPKFTVQMRVNVPGTGERVFTQTNITAHNIQAAIAEATAALALTVLAVQQTADV